MLTHLYDLVRQRAATYPDAVALGGQQGLVWKTLRSRELLELVDRLAEELAGRGVREGDRVVLWMPNHWRTPVYFFAVWKLGAIVVPFDREMNPEAGARIVASVQPRLIISGYGERPAWARRRKIVEWWEPGAETANRHPRTASPPSPTLPSDVSESEARFTGVSDRKGGGGPSLGWTPPTEELAALVFTSGTTGSPKGCMISHANLCSQIEPCAEAMPLDPSCRFASVLPLSHLFELTCGLLFPLASGAAVHYVPSRRGPDIVRVLKEQRITHMVGVPQLLGLMGQALEAQLAQALPRPALGFLKEVAARLPLEGRRSLFWFVHRKLGGQLQVMASGGAALPAQTQLLWEGLGIRVIQGYGASECSPVIACGTADGKTPVGSVGRPIRGVEVRQTAEGELLARGPNVISGYWKDPERTAEVLQDGWYATGDLVRIDEDGNLWIQGRARDLIVLPSGMNLWPQDVEDVLRGHRAVKDAALIAVPTAAGGATLHAYLIPSESRESVEIGEIVATCNGRLAQHQRVATASWWPEADFPRTSTLKVRRNLLPLPEAASAVKVESVLAADDPVGQAIAGVARVAGVQPQQSLAELGLDSLGLVELVVALEAKTGTTIGDGDLRLDMTVQQVREVLLHGPNVARGTEADAESALGEQPLWPYTWGQAFRPLAAPIDALYQHIVTRTILLGGRNLDGLTVPVIFAGTHRGWPDMPLVRRALKGSRARHLARRLVPANAAFGIAAGRIRISGIGLWPWYGILAFGLFPIQRERNQEASLRRLVQIGQAGNAILIFPQGFHARPAQEIAGDPAARFRPGVAHLASALQAPVVPFGLAGTDIVLPPTTEGFKGLIIAGIPVTYRRGPLAIAFGPPLRMDTDEPPEDFTARLQAECFRLSRLAEAALDRANSGDS